MEKLSPATRNWLVVIGVLIAAGIAAYFVGEALEAAAAKQRYATLSNQLTAADARVAALQSTNRLLSANVWAYRATVALDDRNFGTANDAVAKTSAALKGVNAAAAGLDGNSLAAVQTEAVGTKIAVATNLQQQRSQLIRLAADVANLVQTSQSVTNMSP